MKPGWKTSEFWMSVAAMLVGAIIGSGLLDTIPGQIDDQIVGVIATLLAALGYTVNRSWVKGSASNAEAIMKVASSDPK